MDDEFRKSIADIELNRCPQCISLWAVDGRRDDSLLLKAYERIPKVYFGEIEGNQRYKNFYGTLENILEKYAQGSRVCDVGCGDGSFLASLGAQWHRVGIEPSCHGVKLAERKGVTVVQGTLKTNPNLDRFDIITAIDVIEHITDLDDFLVSARAHLSDSGIILLVTGDSAALTARIAGIRWSYIRWSGHISIVSSRGLNRLLQRNGFDVIANLRCDHPAGPGLLAWLRVFFLEPLRRLIGRPPSWYPFCHDHQIVVASVTNN